MDSERLISLVDYLALQAGCMYISDLRSLTWSAQLHLKHCIKKLAPEYFSAFQWQDAVEYLTGQTPQVNDVGALKDLLLESSWKSSRCYTGI